MNILSNNIGAEQANKLIKIMESHSNLKTLCGFSGDETELDLSNKNLSAGCGVLVANEVKNNGAMTSLNISNNSIGEIEAIKKKNVPTWSIGDEVEWKGMEGKAVYWSGNPDYYMVTQTMVSAR